MNTDDQFAAWMAEEARISAIYADIEAKASEASDAWRKAWPDACPHCNGWGLFMTHCRDLPSPDIDPCEHYADLTICHRCGKPGLSSEAEGPCQYCGWNFDDGDPAATHF